MRAVTVSLVALSALTWAALIPLPLVTIVDGVVWVPERSRVRTGVGGFVERLEVESGEPVKIGQVLMVSRNPELSARAEVMKAQLSELEARMESYQRQDLVQLELAREQVETVQAQLNDLIDQLDALVVRSHVEGVFVLREPQDLTDSFLPRGAMVGFISRPDDIVARVAIPQASVDLVRSDTRAVEVRMAHDLARRIPARVEREVPGASLAVPSLVLAVEGGGSIPLDPRVDSEPTAFEALFQFDIAFPLDIDMLRYGERVHVRFDHGEEAAARQLYRQVRQVFLKRFDV
ncbi:MAG: hypothetical protein DWQ08_15690 [Proteobacteria bacterium]|nr:MAG: hypothetical protein DWQ08_15690 [Pseudomonadota bacterium]